MDELKNFLEGLLNSEFEDFYPLSGGASAEIYNIVLKNGKKLVLRRTPEKSESRLAISKKIEARTLEYEERFANPFIAAERGFLDDVIIPSNSRFRLIQAFSKLINKTQKNPDKKFGNIPL